jgi:hypothetical protein
MESTKESRKKISFGDYVLWFPKGNKSHLGKFTKKWFGPYKLHHVLPNNIMLLVTIEKFETNPVLVDVNKFKPYKYMDFEVFKKITTNVSILGIECRWSSKGKF